MTMSKEMERLKSKIKYINILINLCEYKNFKTKSNKYDKLIEEYQNKLSEVYKKIRDLKEE